MFPKAFSMGLVDSLIPDSQGAAEQLVEGRSLPPGPISAHHSRWALVPWGVLRAARKVQTLLRLVPERTESLALSQRLLFPGKMSGVRHHSKQP